MKKPRPLTNLELNQQRFWNRVNKTSQGGCWEWSGYLNRKGYGECACKTDGVWKTFLCHRISFFLTFGPIYDDIYILHKCDNPKCVNPDHLFKGTLSDNVKDCVNKKRHSESRKTHCKRGHALINENLYNLNRNVRCCKICSNNLRLIRRRRERELVQCAR